jgi:peptide/nickel transport system substrate-binding protein
MSEESARSTALLTGSVDLLPDVPLLDAALIRQEPSLKLVGNASVLGCMLILNLRQPPMSVASFRLLINRAIDREALVNAATANEATPQHLLIPADHWAALDDPMQVSDPESLRQDFRELGYPVGLRLRMIIDERNVSLSNAAVFLQEQFAFIGIALSVDPLDEDDLGLALEEADYDIFATNIDAWRDPHELFRPLVMSDGQRNVGGYSSAKADRLIRSGVLVESPERRAPYYQQLQRILLQDVPIVVLYLQNYFDSMTTLLQDYPMYPPISGLGMRHAWLSRPSREAETWVPVAEHLKESYS